MENKINKQMDRIMPYHFVHDTSSTMGVLLKTNEAHIANVRVTVRFHDNQLIRRDYTVKDQTNLLVKFMDFQKQAAKLHGYVVGYNNRMDFIPKSVTFELITRASDYGVKVAVQNVMASLN